MHHNITALRSYRATLIPHGVDAAQLDQLADARLLPVLRLKAASASHAQACALLASRPWRVRSSCVSPMWSRNPWSRMRIERLIRST